MKKSEFDLGEREIISPEIPEPITCSSGEQAVGELMKLYDSATVFLKEKLELVQNSDSANRKFRAFYPELKFEVLTYGYVDTRLSFGHVTEPGVYKTTITRPKLFEQYLINQINLLIGNHHVPISVGVSNTPIPIHFAIGDGKEIDFSPQELNFSLRDVFDTPDLTIMHDEIVNGTGFVHEDGAKPLAPFSAPRIDYSLARLQHYTGTGVENFQQFILFTNYQFYVDKFVDFARSQLAEPNSGYLSLVTSGGSELTNSKDEINWPARMPQMPTCHLTRKDGTGISLVNIGVGPSNAKTATDHIAVLRPSAWIMLGHCAGLRNSQNLGDYVLAHAYLREDQVLDNDLPLWVPIPPLAEIQVAIEDAVAKVTRKKGYDLKRVMRTGTVASVDNRNWELGVNSGSVRSLSQSRAIALDMESATIAANGFRFRVPYGTLLCVSDKPLHGVLKMPGMASEFFRTQVNNHLLIGILAITSLREMPQEFLHSRKLRSFEETSFL